MKISELLDEIVEKEGREFTNHPKDRGGPTKFGITQQTLGNWLGRSATVDEVRNLDENTARTIYKSLYVDKPGFNEISDEHLRALVVDSGVNHGVRRATRWLQMIIHAHPDGFFGPKSIAALACHDPQYVWYRYLSRRIKFYGAIVAADRSQAEFIHGWNRRAASFLDDKAEDMK